MRNTGSMKIMKIPLTLALIVCLAGLTVPAAAQRQSGEEADDRPGHRSVQGRTGPLAQAVVREAARAALDSSTAPLAATPAGFSDRSDWSRVHGLGGEEITLTLDGAPPVKRWVLRRTIDESGFTVLNLTDPSLPDAAKDALADAAWWSSNSIALARGGARTRLNRHVTLAPDGVFLDDRKVGELDHIVETVDRSRVVEIRLEHRAAARGALWGALAGLALGAGTVLPACGTSWEETSSCTNLTPLPLFLFPALGAGFGAAVGAGHKISSVIYRAQSSDSVARP